MVKWLGSIQGCCRLIQLPGKGGRLLQCALSIHTTDWKGEEGIGQDLRRGTSFLTSLERTDFFSSSQATVLGRVEFFSPLPQAWLHDKKRAGAPVFQFCFLWSWLAGPLRQVCDVCVPAAPTQPVINRQPEAGPMLDWRVHSL